MKITTNTTASVLSWRICGRCSATASSSTRENLRSTDTPRSWRKSWTSCFRCGCQSLPSTLSQMWPTPVQSLTRGMTQEKFLSKIAFSSNSCRSASPQAGSSKKKKGGEGKRKRRKKKKYMDSDDQSNSDSDASGGKRHNI